MERSPRHSVRWKSKLYVPMYFTTNLQTTCACTCTCAYECTNVYIQTQVHVFKYTWKKTEQEGTKPFMWYGRYASHKVTCFQFFMPAVITMEAILKLTCQL